MKLLSKMLSFTLVKDGKDGEDGKPGKPGPIIYPEGKWDKNIEYTSDEYSRPFVEYKGEFYFLNSEKAPIGVDPATDVAQNKGNWVFMEKFKAIFAEILFSDFANLGDFIIFGEYIMSTWGRDIKGNVTDNYKDFPDNFFPNLLINASTGKIIANDGVFSGVLEGATGTFSGYLKSDFIKIEDSDADFIGYEDGRKVFQLNDNLNVITDRETIKLPDDLKYSGASVLISPSKVATDVYDGTYVETKGSSFIVSSNSNKYINDYGPIQKIKGYNCRVFTQFIASIIDNKLVWTVVSPVIENINHPISLIIDVNTGVFTYEGGSYLPYKEKGDLNKIQTYKWGKYITEIYVRNSNTHVKINLLENITQNMHPVLVVNNLSSGANVIANGIKIGMYENALLKPIYWRDTDKTKTWVKIN